jgi:hypothetical protein
MGFVTNFSLYFDYENLFLKRATSGFYRSGLDFSDGNRVEKKEKEIFWKGLYLFCVFKTNTAILHEIQ